MKLLLLLLLLLPFAGFAQTGSISGNAFYHYNDFVGDKPEAGASVYLFADSTNAPLITQCDVQGNYRFEKVKPGRYMILVVSSNTYDNGAFWLSELENQKGRYGSFFGFDITDIGPSYDSIAICDSALARIAEQKASVWKANKQMKEIQQALDAIRLQTGKAIDAAYRRTAFYPKLSLGGLLHKIDFSIVSVSADENKTVISNFGVSSR